MKRLKSSRALTGGVALAFGVLVLPAVAAAVLESR